MAATKVLSGARCKFGTYIDGKPNYIGFFKTVSWGYSVHAEPVYILGRHSPAEIEYTSQDVVSITASGWRVFKYGPHDSGTVPRLQDLLLHDYIALTIVDRQQEVLGNAANSRVATFRHVRPVGYSTSVDARQLQEITVNFLAILVDDEGGTRNFEGSFASVLEGPGHENDPKAGTGDAGTP